MPYIGNELAAQFQAFETQTITGDGSTGYTLDRAVANGKELLVYINNVKQEEGSGKSYTASGTTITFSEAVASGDSCYLVYMGLAMGTVTAPDGSIVSAQLANANLEMPNTLDMNGKELILDADADTSIEASADDTIVIDTAGSERVRIDSNGALQIGGTTNAGFIDFDSTSLQLNTQRNPNTGAFVNTGKSHASIALRGDNGDASIRFGTSSANNTASTERMRIDANGTLLINDTGRALGCKAQITYSGSSEQGLVFENTVNSASGGAIRFVDSDGDFSGGGIYYTDSNSINYQTTSDYRLKENIVTDWDATTELKKLKPSKFNFKKTPEKTVQGFIAHEVSDIVPEAIIGVKDGTEKYIDDDGKEKTREAYQSIDQSKLVPLLTKALQEVISEIDTLKEKVKSLESK
tara:strand:+ start:34 stop:1260 length:1227 start_codon:yes stop_codon:yes gene_type:complete